MTIALALSLTLVVGTFLFHFMVLRWLSTGMSTIAMAPGLRILIIVLAALSAHLAEVGIYAVVYALAVEVLRIGAFEGLSVSHPMDYFYFSLVSYTSLGLGDIFPSEHLRFLTGIEALNGLLLIAWSGSFIYIAMGRLWQWENCAEPPARGKD